MCHIQTTLLVIWNHIHSKSKGPYSDKYNNSIIAKICYIKTIKCHIIFQKTYNVCKSVLILQRQILLIWYITFLQACNLKVCRNGISFWLTEWNISLESPKFKNKCLKPLQPPVRYADVHTNPDQDCCLLQITTIDFIYIPIVMGMTVTLVSVVISLLIFRSLCQEFCSLNLDQIVSKFEVLYW